jgi:hypothetical protein
VGKTYQPGQ